MQTLADACFAAGLPRNGEYLYHKPATTAEWDAAIKAAHAKQVRLHRRQQRMSGVVCVRVVCVCLVHCGKHSALVCAGACCQSRGQGCGCCGCCCCQNSRCQAQGCQGVLLGVTGEVVAFAEMVGLLCHANHTRSEWGCWRWGGAM
jgi:hypothetical protein